MNQKHVPSMELCQQFVDLCSKNNITLPETEFYWVGNELLSSCNEDDALKLSYVEGLDNVKSKPIPAPLVSELGEWLPPAIKVKDALAYLKYVPHSDKQTDVIYSKVGWFHQESDYKEANARQKMINYLIAEGIITTL